MARIWNKHKQSNTPLKRKVFVGMSGGVDSSVAAALLKRAGYRVVGVFIKVWEPGLESPSTRLGAACGWREDRRDAMRVAAVLDIPLVTIDLAKEYEREVVRYMVREYRAGRTPNPDVECNRAIKFGAFYQWAMKHDADYVATGHYAQIKNGELLMSRDKNKDQTYFLWTLKREQLKHCLFPIGEYKKPEVRKLAKKFGLPTADKKDSQGLCFLGRLDVKKFLQRYIKPKKGKVLDESGRVLGEHNGAWFYTIGEHHYGYVVAKDIKKNVLIVANEPSVLADRPVNLTESNWFGAPKVGKIYQARIRHRGELYSCRIIRERGKVGVEFQKPPLAVAPGQSIVFYLGEKCLGGGVIAGRL